MPTASVSAVLRSVVGPQTPPTRPNPFDKAAAVATAVWIFVGVIDVAVWALVCVMSFELDPPWFLWSWVLGGILVVALRLAAQGYRNVHGPGA